MRDVRAPYAVDDQTTVWLGADTPGQKCVWCTYALRHGVVVSRRTYRYRIGSCKD